MYWIRLIRVLWRLPRTPEEVPLWALTVPLRTWNRAVRFDGKTFGELYGASVDPIARRLLPMRFFYFVFLFLLPFVFAFRGIAYGRSALQYLRHALRRPDLAVSHQDADYTPQEVAWARPDYALGMAYAFEHAFAPKPFFQLDDKRRFVEACQQHNLPLPPMLTREEAIKEGGVYIVKRPKSSLGYGVRLRTAGELEEKCDPTWIIQRRLKNHPTLRVLFGEDAPLCSFRVITQRNPDTGVLDVARCAVRMGRAGSPVDNTMQGGIWANVDLQTGALKGGVMRSDFGHWTATGPVRHLVHPDTGKLFVGTRIPWWDEGRALAVKAHETLAPDAPTLGWDIALADDAPVLLEVNVWTVCYDYEPQTDAFTPACRVLIERVAGDCATKLTSTSGPTTPAD